MRLFKAVLLLYILLCIQISHAQNSSYQVGYLITAERDTISGWVKDRDNGAFQSLYKRIRFIANGNKRPKRYGPNDIVGYGYGNTHFLSVPLREETIFFVTRYLIDESQDKIFLKLVRRNKHITYFKKEFVWDDNDIIDEYPLFYRHGKKELVRVTQGVLGLKFKRLAEYFNDCPELVELILNQKITTVDGVYNYFSTTCSESIPLN
ncbi:hypothetical protein [Fulvivirga lutea]|uniref:DUF4105 domain-containing protein n=1 Tax=Fulvivirga lutea TaxID=2810512 RepID=A0A974WGW0_9BACT|nr:hypothetical protein [Fulvivirga lutea]QSE98293.1 hypothetical protein JR347_04225 [Fulvivirga lutea]